MEVYIYEAYFCPRPEMNITFKEDLVEAKDINDGRYEVTHPWGYYAYFTEPHVTADPMGYNVRLASQTPIDDFKKVLSEALYGYILQQWNDTSDRYQQMLQSLSTEFDPID